MDFLPGYLDPEGRNTFCSTSKCVLQWSFLLCLWTFAWVSLLTWNVSSTPSDSTSISSLRHLLLPDNSLHSTYYWPQHALSLSSHGDLCFSVICSCVCLFQQFAGIFIFTGFLTDRLAFSRGSINVY